MNTNAQQKLESPKAAPSCLLIELVPGWHTEPAAQVLRRERVRGVRVAQIAELALAPPLALPQPESPAEWGQVEWEFYDWQPQGVESRRPRGAGVATLARRLIAQERARARCARPTDFPSSFSRKSGGARG